MHLTSKERQLLQDQKSHEQLCIQKYTEYSQRAQDPELKQLFESYAQKEREHLNTVNQILSGQVPSTQQSGGSSGQQGTTQAYSSPTQTATTSQSQTTSQEDKALCEDMLMTEKYVSGTYDTAVFEFRDTNIRQTLNHIQKEEQEHGEGIFNYMQKKGYYNL